MTIEKAIAYFEDAIRETDEIIEDCSPALQVELIEQKQHFVIALAALHEKLERDKGCEYCNDESCPRLNWQYGLDHILPGYKDCPMCGKRLEVERDV